MPFPTLRDFIQHLDRDGELARVKRECRPDSGDRRDRRPHEQVARPARPQRARQIRAAQLGGKALLFENVEGSDIPVAINTFGSYWRVNQALGTEILDALADRVQQLVKPEIPTTLMEKMKRLPDLIKMASFRRRSCAAGSASRSCSKATTPT